MLPLRSANDASADPRQLPDRTVLCVVLSDAHDSVAAGLREEGWTCDEVFDLAQAAARLRVRRFQVGVLLCRHGDEAVWSQLRRFLGLHAELEWIGIFGRALPGQPGCSELILAHLFDHHTLPVDLRRLDAALGHALGRAVLRSSLGQWTPPQEPHAIIGVSAAAQRLKSQIARMARVDAPVLITGESGSGKELAAQAIHRLSTRAGKPFVPVNCGAIQPSLIQSQLFGHVRGAFTGAVRDERGLIEAADGGTLFLDEIGDLPQDLQVSLLRFLQERTIQRLGSTRTVEVDVRIIAATHVDLGAAISAGTFREDLFYRLDVLPLAVPPLRERRADIPLLAQAVFRQYAGECAPPLRGFSRRALAAMQAHDWPGNVRELINRVRRAIAMSESRLISAADLGLEPPDDAPEPLDSTRGEAERHAVEQILARCGRNLSQAARMLGISRMTLYRMLAKHGIER